MAVTDSDTNAQDVIAPSVVHRRDGALHDIAATMRRPPAPTPPTVPARHERGPVLSHLSARMVALKAGVVAADVLTIAMAYTVSTLVVGRWFGWGTDSIDDHLRIAGLSLPIWPILFAVAEAYPDLKASTNFQQLQSELTRTEDQLAFARQYYNDACATLNRTMVTIPWSLFVGMSGVEKGVFYDAPEGHSAPPTVDFG